MNLKDDDPGATEAAVDAALANLPQHMRLGMLYRGKDGRWYHADGSLVNRAERRRAGVK